jgi:hypothetical protein
MSHHPFSYSPMFDHESFLDEITDTSEAEACVDYLSRNEHAFRKELAESGKSYDEIQDEVRQVWLNLLKSCSRVSFRSHTTDAKSKQYSV